MGKLRKLAVLGIAAGMLLAPIRHSNAEILQKTYTQDSRQTKIQIDTEKKEFRTEPDMDEGKAREILSLALLEQIVYETEPKNKDLSKKTEEFFWKNPSEMLMRFSEPIGTTSKNIAEFKPFDIPKLDINVIKTGNELGLNFKLQSPDYSFRWGKSSSIGIFYPKGTRITRKVDEAYVLADSKDNLGFRKTETDKWNDEREAYGKLAEAAVKYGLNKAEKNPLGVMLSLGIKIENLLEEDEKSRREEIASALKEKYNWISYSPADFFATPEQGRLIRINFDGRPESFAFFINSDVELNISEYGTQTKKSGNLASITGIEMKKENVLKKTSAGRIIGQSLLVSQRLDGYIEEYKKNRRLGKLNSKEKHDLYENISLWKAQLEPFLDMLNKITNKQLGSSLEEVAEYNTFRKKSETLTEKIFSLNQASNSYTFLSKYSKGDKEKILELFDRELKALNENNFELYSSCFTKNVLKSKQLSSMKEFDSRKKTGAEENWEIENVSINGWLAIVNMKYFYRDESQSLEMRYSVDLAKENSEWKDMGRNKIIESLRPISRQPSGSN
ncbi:MAG: hypothetical protein V1886_03715 [archaeon]